MADESLTFLIEAKDLASKTLARVDAQVAGLDPTFTKATTKGVLFGNLLTGAAYKVGEALRGVVDFVGDSIGAASALEESQNKVAVVFGDSVGAVNDFAETSAEAAGISKNAALEAAGAFGNMFNTIGVARDASADMSVTMVQLASDMASFNDEDPSEMLDKLRSGLAGEAEPLRRFGVLLSEAAVKQEAYATGIATVGSELTEQQKVQARYSLILKQTANQQGDFARTSDSMANSQRSLEAQLHDASTELGEVLLPVMLKLVNFAKDDLIPILRDGVIPAIEGIGEAIGGTARFINNFLLDMGATGQKLHDIADEIGVDFQTVKDKVRFAMDSMGKSFEEALVYARQSLGGTSDSAEQSMDDINQIINKGMGTVASTMEEGAKEGADAAAKEIGKTPEKAADELLANQFHLQDATDELKAFMDEALTPKEERRRAQGFLNSKAYADGIHNGNALVRRKTRELAAEAEAVLAKPVPGAYDAGKNISLDFARGIYAGSGDAFTAAARLAAGVAGFLPINSPPEDPRSALKNYEHVGDNLVEGIVGGIRRGLGIAEGASGDLASALSPSLAPYGAGAAYGVGGGGVTVNINSYFPPTPAQARGIAEQIGPGLVRWMTENA